MRIFRCGSDVGNGNLVNNHSLSATNNRKYWRKTSGGVVETGKSDFSDDVKPLAFLKEVNLTTEVVN